MAEQILGYGRCNMAEYSVDEYRASLVQAFKKRGADFIVLDSNMSGQRFRAACVAWAIVQGLVYNDRNDNDGQCKVSSFRLTDKGKEEIIGQPS